MLDSLRWAHEVLLVDSFSTDATLELAGAYPNVRVVQRKFDTFAQQCNFGLDQIATPWVLSLDADYFLPHEFHEEIVGLDPPDRVCDSRPNSNTMYFGKKSRASLYPPRTILYRREAARYRDEGHGHRVQIAGEVLPMKTAILHDDRKPLSRWFDSQRRCAEREADHLLSAGRSSGLADRIRRWIVPAAPAVFFYTLLIKRCRARWLARLLLCATTNVCQGAALAGNAGPPIASQYGLRDLAKREHG